MSLNYYAKAYKNGQEIRSQSLGSHPKHWRAKEVLKALFSQIKPIAAKDTNNIYYIEITAK
jgi:hypothetical protein